LQSTLSIPADPSRAPDFALSDHTGGTFRLADRRDVGTTLLVFFRGHWCPYCRRYLGKLQANLLRFQERNVLLVGVSPEPPSTSAALVKELNLEFPLVADVDGRVIDAYGTRNGFSSVRSLLPHPAVFVVDADLNVRFKSIDKNYKKRTTLRTIFQVLDELGAD